MTESKNPVAEAEVVDQEMTTYELAFHVLPTVAEGEVADVFTALKKVVTDAGGSLLEEEAPQRFELAYPIVKRTEGKNRTYRSAYFGWVRVTLQAVHVEETLAEIEARADILRALIVKLTPAEMEHPFYFHEALAEKKVVTMDEEASVAVEEVKKEEVKEEEEEASAPEETKEVAAEAETEEVK